MWAEDYLGRQALHLAAQVGTSEAVMLLIKLGADPNQVGSHQMTPLHYAAKVTVCLLKLHNDLRICCSQEGHADVVKKLLQCGADVLLTDDKHRTGK